MEIVLLLIVVSITTQAFYISNKAKSFFLRLFGTKTKKKARLGTDQARP